MSPKVRQREIIQGKVVQTGSYPADWSQDRSLEATTGSTAAVWELRTPISSMKSLGDSRKNKLVRWFLCPSLWACVF